MRAESDKRAPHEHFPAPYALIELWERHGGSLEDMLAAERESFARLLPLPSTQNLIRDFFLRRHLKANAKGESGIGRIHVVGAGAMGADIGAWCALKGMRVTLEDPQNGALAKAVANANELFARKLSGSERIAAQDRFMPDPDGTGLRHADLVIEAAPEKEDLKRSIYQRIEAEVGADVILATNTSSLDLEALALGLEHPGRFVGLHFFNPVSKLDLVEVVRHERVDQSVLSRAMALVGAIGKLPLPSAATPGFLVNRALLPYLGEALLMVRHGMQPERVDAAAESFGMPLGPVELADQVGLDICLAVARSLSDQPGNGLDAVREWLETKVGQGELGRKSGKGFYEYDHNGKPIKQPVGKSDEDQDPGDIVDRLIMPLLNEVSGALEEGVIDDEDSVDAAMVFGAGFAPFRGGPMKYARQRGLDDVADRLEQLAREHGTRFEPREWWRKAAR
ncbi:MAG: 3-hydroxyacyl-CoA dehydrogenase NAD-binding domain-containing protein [Pseudomonadota bacterium]|nr:3-hydroxyacyl-CoA dehydrogenase NAD-binding domain-containing protein [Pseudomonadota bacterium]